MTYEVKDLFEMLQRIERRIGTIHSTSMSTITGEISQLRNNDILVPRVEVDIPIIGDSFNALYPPILLGDGYAIGGHVTISMFDVSANRTVIHKWRDVTFNGITGTINGANGTYNGKHVTISYYYRNISFYSFSISNGMISATKVLQPTEDIIINDEVTNVSYSIKVTEHGYIDLIAVESTDSQNTVLTDEATGTEYQLSIIEGYFSYEEI